MPDFDLTPLRQILPEFATQGRTALLPALHAAQSIYGYLPEPVAAEVGQSLGVPLSEVYGVIDFYHLFYREPMGKTLIHVCRDPACALAGADGLMKTIDREITFHFEGGDRVGEVTVERAPCLGLCEQAPAIMVNETAVGHADQFRPAEPSRGLAHHPGVIAGGDLDILTGGCMRGRPSTLQEYRADGGYSGLVSALRQSRESVVAEVKAAGLVGRGGAAFPTGLKWEGAAKAMGEPKYVVCNADEAEPGTFKDRVLMEGNPHLILEGILIAAYAIGASRGYLYIRGEYVAAYQSMQQALVEAHVAGLLGEQVLGFAFSFDLELRRGAGAYVCGEETAQFESIEGKRGFPRVKPPFPTTHGLFGKPTAINNVETLANVPYILQNGAARYREIGTEKSPGPKLFCVSGDVVRPGLYEVPFGVTIRHLLEDLAGGIRGGHRLKAILFGGAAGAFATEKDLDVRLSFEDLRAASLPLGSGVVTVFDQTRDLRDTLLRLAHFFADESCGKCYPCQIGTQRQHEILRRVAAGQTQPDDAERLADVGWTMADSSLCGLGQTAASAVLSAMKLWPDLFQCDEASS
ncbi:MAG: NADH-quinone oxidoreductase subunit NuoF [Anaerolineaceae bacterium]|nr:NADH-quinone oxidoreductase subunit NuoF [Anaerolineaceae bacterium]